MALQNHFILTQQHGPSLQEGETRLRDSRPFRKRSNVLGFQGTQQRHTPSSLWCWGTEHHPRAASANICIHRYGSHSSNPSSTFSKVPKDSCHIWVLRSNLCLGSTLPSINSVVWPAASSHVTCANSFCSTIKKASVRSKEHSWITSISWRTVRTELNLQERGDLGDLAKATQIPWLRSVIFSSTHVGLGYACLSNFLPYVWSNVWVSDFCSRRSLLEQHLHFYFQQHQPANWTWIFFWTQVGFQSCQVFQNIFF